jgi:hypothetical protein
MSRRRAFVVRSSHAEFGVLVLPGQAENLLSSIGTDAEDDVQEW